MCLFIWQIFTDLLKARHCSRHLVLTRTVILWTLKPARKEPGEWITVSSVSSVLSSSHGQQISNITWVKLLSMEDIWYLGLSGVSAPTFGDSSPLFLGTTIPPICGGPWPFTWPKLGQSVARPEEFEFQTANKNNDNSSSSKIKIAINTYLTIYFV